MISMIEAQALTKDYDGKRAVDGLTFTVQPGIVTGFLGPNGSGKSTTMRLILGLDALDGRVATRGWLDVSSVQALTLALQFDSLPLAAIIYTDIARDGTLEGPNVPAITALAKSVRTPVVASGGVGDLQDLERLAALPIAGCVVGRALYDGRFSLADAIGRSSASRSASLVEPK